jgi:hypothetical protein
MRNDPGRLEHRSQDVRAAPRSRIRAMILLVFTVISVCGCFIIGGYLSGRG